MSLKRNIFAFNRKYGLKVCCSAFQLVGEIKPRQVHAALIAVLRKVFVGKFPQQSIFFHVCLQFEKSKKWPKFCLRNSQDRPTCEFFRPNGSLLW
jgi:hypothetical protein